MNNLEFARQIDERRKRIENKFVSRIYDILRNISQDAGNLFFATGNIPSQELALNYTPEFVSVARDIMRETAREFGFDLRAEYSHSFAKSFYLKVDNLDILLADEELEQVNREFATEMLLFIANESERQALYIQNTNFKQLDEAKQKAILQNARKIQNLQENISKINNQLSQLAITELITGVTNDRIDILEDRKAKLERFLRQLQENQRQNLSQAIQDDLDAKAESRSELIASQISGLMEGEARESELIKLGILLEGRGNLLGKEWIGILDNKIRPNHAIVTGQRVRYDAKFFVGGFQASHPRDKSLPIEETVNCRCVYRVILLNN
jgi:hypothetical protein